MTQTAYYSDIKLFVSMYKNALKRIKGISLIFAFISVLIFPLTYLMEINDMQKYGYSMPQFTGDPKIYTTVSVAFFFAFMVLGAVLLTIQVNSFMHNKKAVDVFHALPVKRYVMLLSNYCAVLTVLFLSNALCYGLVSMFNSIYVMNASTLDIVIEFLRVCLMIAVVTAVSFFASVCCNASFDSFVFSGVFLFIVPAVTFLINIVFYEYCFGFSMDVDSLLKSIRFSPPIILFHTFFKESFDVVYGVYFAAVLVIMALSCFVYSKRKSEFAQSGKSDRPIYGFMAVLVSVCSGLMLSLGQTVILGISRTESDFKIISTTILFTLATFLVFNGIMARNPKPDKKALILCVISVILSTGTIVSISRDFFGYEQYVPQVQDIKSITINYRGPYSDIVKSYNPYGNDTSDFESEEVKNIIADFHKTTVTDFADVQNQQKDSSNISNVTISYTLNSGRVVTREYYSYISEQAAQKLYTLENTAEFKEKLYPVLSESAEYVDDIRITDSISDAAVYENFTQEQIAVLYEAIAQDERNITYQSRSQNKGVPLAVIEIEYKDYKQWNLSKEEMDWYRGNYGDSSVLLYDNVYFYLTPGSTNTLKALESMGITQFTDLNPENITAYVSTYAVGYGSMMHRNTEYVEYIKNYDEYSEYKPYTDANQIQQLLNEAKYIAYPSQTIPYRQVVFVYNDDAEKEYYYVYYVQDNTLDFLN